MSHFGQYGRGLDSFVQEWGLNQIGDDKFDPVVLEALQSVLDAISPERGYLLSFVPTGTAATAFSTKRVVITSEALRGIGITDPDRWRTNRAINNRYSNGRRFRISAGMVCHEVSHIRYGQDTAGAVDKAYAKSPNLSLARRISNVLDDTRIEMAFAWDFPGLGRNLFNDVLEWVARKNRKNEFTLNFVERVIDRSTALDAILLASRYDRWYVWPEGHKATDLCRDFGKKWAKKYTADDSVELHLAGVKECIDFLRQFPKPAKPEPEPEPESGGDKQPGQQQPDDSQGEPQPQQSSVSFNDEDEDMPEDGEPEPGSGEDDEDEPIADPDDDGTGVLDNPEPKVPDTDSAIESSGTAGDVSMNKTRDQIAKTRDVVSAEETGGGTVVINRVLPVNKTPARVYGTLADLSVADEVRQAFEATRYSHDEWAGGNSNGRFRSRDACRAAAGDLNVFSRRESESSTRVHLALLIDHSGSMGGWEDEQARTLAATIAAAMETSPVFRQSVWRYKFKYNHTALDRIWSSDSTVSIEDGFRRAGMPGGSTPTGEALYALGREMVDGQKSGEALLIISLTDGAPDSVGQVKYAVQHWTDRGVAIIGTRVGIGAKSNPSVMKSMRSQYGDDQVIEFLGDYKALAEDIAVVAGRVLAGAMLPK